MTSLDSLSGGMFDVPASLSSEESTNPYKEELQLAVKLALEAGRNIFDHCDRVGTSAAASESDLGITTKSHASDFATSVDVRNEHLVVAALRHRFPAHAVLGEEATGTAPPAPLRADADAHTWIVDPIDGTANFASGLPLTCVSIGLCRGTLPVLGVVHAPLTRELYVAVRGHGAFRNGARLQGAAVVRRPLSAAVVVHEFGSTRDDAGLDAKMAALRRVLAHGCRASRSLGSGVLDLCYVASG
eukprot:CAMPEP_0194290456 /NCGR_PEP_ID=MMETSP0169-20130528/41277_1 /TAXON_ID=218684 /ORGANISM="Corethron pennatum, Strain L29A3" /LENGTH=243 /DNA_ID=CAMNT_0039038037 /DNA_START=43 /DNA_END=771 /DNA_ORIENTATION=-